MSNDFINECKNRANGNRLGKIQVAEEVTFQGKDISIENSIASTIDNLNLYGYTHQNNYSGKNKLPNLPDVTRVIRNVTVSVISDEITVIGTSTGSGGRLDALFYFKLPAGSYKVGLTNSVQSYLYLSNTSTGEPILWTRGKYSEFTFEEETQITLGVNLLPDITYNDKFKVMIVSSDITDYTYEPYTGGKPSPSPDYPQRIEVVTGSVSVKSVGKNQWNNDLVNTNYEPYQESTITYDLGDNFFAEQDCIKNGVLNKKTRHLRLAIADMNNANESYPGWLNQSQLKEDYPNANTSFRGVNSNIVSNITTDNTKIGLNTYGKTGLLIVSSSLFNGMTQTEIKENYPDLIFDLYYEIPNIEQEQLTSTGELRIFEGNTIITNNYDCNMEVIAQKWNKEITNSNNLQSMEINSGCYAEGNIIGSVYAKCLKANFIADNNNLVDKSIQAQIGVKYADLNEEYINMGKYKVEHPNNEITANYSQITAYSELYTNLDKKYVCNIDYSSRDKTVSDLYVDVCEQLELIPVTTVFINSTIPITSNPFTNGEKNRTVLQTIGKIACSFIDIDNGTNQIDLCWLSDSEEPDYIFYKNDYVSAEGGQVVCGPINCLIIKNSQIDDENITIKDEESIELNGEHSIIISEDYILHSAELREQAITDIWNRVKGMKYVDCKLTTYYGKPFLKLGAKIRVYISNTEYFDTYVLKHVFTYDGAFTSVIESSALTEQEIKTKQDVSLGEVLRNTQIDINKQTGEIKSKVIEATNIVSEQNDIITNISASLTDTNTNLNTLQQALATVKGSIVTQSAEAVEMLFKQTGIEDAVNAVSTTLSDAENQLNTITEYVRFEGAKIILGKSTSQSSLVIENDIIKFMTGDNISAYISENQLYITDSTILNKLQIGYWETKPDSKGNLNTRWVGGN